MGTGFKVSEKVEEWCNNFGTTHVGLPGRGIGVRKTNPVTTGETPNKEDPSTFRIRKFPWKKPLTGGLFEQGFFAFLGGALCILGILSFALYWGVSSSIEGWNQREASAIRDTVRRTLLRVQEQYGRLDPIQIHQALADSLNPSLFVYVEEPAGTVVYLYRQGEVVQGKNPGDTQEKSGQGRNFLRRHGKDIRLEELHTEGALIARFAAGTLGFEMTDSNAQFLSTLKRSILLGLAGALLLSFLVGYGFSLRISRQSLRVADGLTAISGGRRDVQFPSNLVRELRIIARNAEKLQERLSQEEALRRQWTSDITHDLRTPVTTLRGQLEGLIDGVFPLTKERLEKIYREILRMQALVQDLSELTRIESPEFKPHLVPVSPRRILADLHSRFEVQASEKGCSLEGSWTVESFDADEKLLFRALSNLVQNALQYGKPGRVELSFAEKDGGILIDVTNPGTIPAEHIPHLFHRLYRGDPSRAQEGSGLGLAIVEAIAKAHGGRVEFQNTENGQSRFRLFLHQTFTKTT